jgi:hypothetical protein
MGIFSILMYFFKLYVYLCGVQLWKKTTKRNTVMIDILKFTIPSLVVLLSVWIVMRYLLRGEEERRLWEMKKNTEKEVTPIRLRAYERLALLLERTEPEQLLSDLNLTQMTKAELEQRLLLNVRREWEHNMSQQIYVGDDVWAKVMKARDEIASFIHTMALQMPAESTTLDYAKVLMSAYRLNGTTPHQIAMEALKDEVRQMW